ncbi:MAG: HNH endonuclease, partial [Candidatus Dormibacteraeota bacterium]|nr:HNH endonuclease [Candidatus Dormibacteraeota bacterium]
MEQIDGAVVGPELEQLMAASDTYRSRPKSGRSREQIAFDLLQLRHLIDQAEIEFAQDAALLAQGDLWSDWGSTSPIHWIRHYCKTSTSVAADRVNVGEHLEKLPQSAAAVATGAIGFGHLSVIARTAEALTQSPTAEPFDETQLLEAAKDNSVGRLWYRCLHIRHRLDAEGVAREQRQDAEERYLQLTEGEDGWLFLKGGFDPIGAAAIRTAIEPLARHSGDGDGRNRERRQADAMVDLATHAMDTGQLPQHASQRPHLQVTTTLETLQALIGAPAGEMALSLPISAKTVQRIACDSSVTRVLLGADSAVVDAGRAKRVVSGGARRLLDTRDRHCRWPGCERPASWSSAHHVVHWANGGKTDLSNMILLCQHHHWMVHEGGWRL